MRPRSEQPLLVALFAVSGAAGLVDQVCFSKYLSYVVGSTAYAVSAVLAAFMTGLALGAALGGRLSTRIRRPLVAYGVVEIAAGVAVALAPLAFDLLTPLYVGLVRWTEGSLGLSSAARWLVTVLLVVVPTTAMGMTLPLLSPWVSRGEDRERRLGGLYAANTLGGALGALGAAYLILPSFGIAGTLRLSAAASVGVGLIAIAAARGLPSVETEASEVSDGDAETAAAVVAVTASDTPAWRLLFYAGLSGALVFMAEVVSTHLLAVIIGNSAYAFGLILAVFLVCLFAGASLAPWARRRSDDGALGLSFCATALACSITLPLWDDLPFFFGGLGKYITTFEGRELVRAAVAFLILCLPATAMGLTFPLLLVGAASQRQVGRVVGRLTALNTLGAVLGALATGYLVLPWLGSQRSLALIAAIFALGAVLELGRRPAAAVAAVAGLFALLGPRWLPDQLTAGNNVYFDSQGPAEEVLMVREDVHGGITTVLLRDGVHTLYTNGKFQGNDGWEINAQRYFAHYPCLFVPRFDRALVIGLGTATTLGTLATYDWKSLDVVEISPSIAEAAARFFHVPNRGALDDPRVTVHHDDGRNFLLVRPDRFDLISMELSSVWFAGASSLYSREYYRLVREHLAPGGIFQQWVQLHHIYRPVFAAMLHTLRLEFEHVALFYGGGQGILVASREPLTWSRSRTLELARRQGVLSTLPDGRPLTELTRDILVMDAGMDRFLDESARLAGVPLASLLSSDDNLFLEYQTPRGNVLPWEARERLVSELRRHRDGPAIARMERP